jgi:hypothetical protein
LFVIALAAALAGADTIEMRNGQILNGKYVGGTATTVRFDANGQTQTVATADIVALTFSGSGGPTTAPSAAAGGGAVPAAASAAPAAAPTPVSVPAGTVLTIKTDNAVSSKDKPGTKFTAKLVGDITAGNATVAKAGSTVYGQVQDSKQAGRLAGKSQLSLVLTGVDIGGKIQPIMTTNFAEAGKGEFRKTARNVAGGALIGNAVNDDGGAGAGAAVGAGVSLIKKGDAVTVPSGCLLEFRTTQPFQSNAL